MTTMISDEALESAANDYMRMLPFLVAVPMRFNPHDGWIPVDHNLFDLAERAGYRTDGDRYPFLLVAPQQDGQKDALVFAPELVGHYPSPTFQQYLQGRETSRQKAFSAVVARAEMMATAIHGHRTPSMSSRPAPRR